MVVIVLDPCQDAQLITPPPKNEKLADKLDVVTPFAKLQLAASKRAANSKLKKGKGKDADTKP